MSCMRVTALGRLRATDLCSSQKYKTKSQCRSQPGSFLWGQLMPFLKLPCNKLFCVPNFPFPFLPLLHSAHCSRTYSPINPLHNWPSLLAPRGNPNARAFWTCWSSLHSRMEQKGIMMALYLHQIWCQLFSSHGCVRLWFKFALNLHFLNEQWWCALEIQCPVGICASLLAHFDWFVIFKIDL